MIKVFAKISPNPSITPFTNGNSMLMANEERRAFIRVRVEREESKIIKVADRGACTATAREADKGSPCSKEMDGYEEVNDDCTSSHFCEPSFVSCPECDRGKPAGVPN